MPHQACRKLHWFKWDAISVYVVGRGTSSGREQIAELFESFQNALKDEITRLENAVSAAQAELVEFDHRLLSFRHPPPQRKQPLLKRQRTDHTPSPLTSLESLASLDLPLPESVDELYGLEEDGEEDSQSSHNPHNEEDEEGDELDLSLYGSSESGVWGDGWKLSLEWVKKHPPVRVPNKRNCLVCKTRCVMTCGVCKVHLHTRSGCYAQYHLNPAKYATGKSRKGHICKGCGRPRKGHPGKTGPIHCQFLQPEAQNPT